MKNLQELNLTELNNTEIKETEGGFLVGAILAAGVALTIAAYDVGKDVGALISDYTD